jgi:hypothetical protein
MQLSIMGTYFNAWKAIIRHLLIFSYHHLFFFGRVGLWPSGCARLRVACPFGSAFGARYHPSRRRHDWLALKFK